MPCAIASSANSVWRTPWDICQRAASTMRSRRSHCMNGTSTSWARWSASETRARRCVPSQPPSPQWARNRRQIRGTRRQNRRNARLLLGGMLGVHGARAAGDAPRARRGGVGSAAKRAGSLAAQRGRGHQPVENSCLVLVDRSALQDRRNRRAGASSAAPSNGGEDAVGKRGASVLRGVELLLLPSATSRGAREASRGREGGARSA